MYWIKKKLYIAHYTTSPGKSFKAQQKLMKYNIPFQKEVEGCILLKVQKGDLAKAKNIINQND